MRNNGCRLCVLILAIVMVLSLTACARDAGAETQPTETSDPMVRLYYHTETLTEDSCIRYEYEENWWEKDSFTVVKYQLTEEGEKDILAESVYVGGVTVTTNRSYPDVSRISMSYYQWETSYSCYENGELTYSRSDMEKDNGFGHIYNAHSRKFDEYGRLIENKYEESFTSEGMCVLDIYTYEYQNLESGSIGTFWDEDDHCAQLYYNSDYRHTRTEWYSANKLVHYTEYEYNTAGCVTKEAFCRIEYGKINWTKYLYETVEVPLSVALKYPMFKWEYVD